MKCEKCHINEATVFLTQTNNGETIQMHLCDACAKESEAILFDSGISFQQFLSGLLEDNKGVQPKNQALTCDQCGMSFNEFRKNSLVGCSKCYTTFSMNLEPIIKRLQSNNVHTGKKPAHVDETQKKQEAISRYERELKIALMEENYEEAALLRDKIRDLKREGQI